MSKHSAHRLLQVLSIGREPCSMLHPRTDKRWRKTANSCPR
jgi:hypothetical protein